MNRFITFYNQNKKRIVPVIAVLGFVCIIFFSSLGATSQNSESKPPRNTSARIALAKAELDAVKNSRSKDGKPGELYPTDLLKAEIVLPVALALIDDEFSDLGIDRVALTKEIKEHPENFRQGVPEHWRSRFLILTPSLEKNIGEQGEKKILSEKTLYKNKKAQERVDAIASKIIAQLPLKPPLKLILVKDDTVNACCLPNGTIFVHSAMLEKVKSDDELAFVLGHEYAHFAARHGNESITKAIFATAGDVLAEDKGNRTEKEGKEWKALFLRLGYMGGSIVGFQLPYSRKMETEADTLGLRYMTRAGYNPQAAVALWQRIGDTKDASWAKYLSTHPEDKKRIINMQNESDILLKKKERVPLTKKIPKWLKWPKKQETSSKENSDGSPDE